MLIYWLVMLVLAVSASLTILKEPKTCKVSSDVFKSDYGERLRRIICIIIAVIFIGISTCRAYTVGYDTINYKGYFDFKNKYPNNIVYEFLYELINFIVVKMGLPFSFVLLFCSIIVFSAFTFVIKKYSIDISFSFFLIIALGIFGNTFNAVRQYLALAMFLFSIKYIRTGGFIKYLILILIASLFHSSAIVLVPIYFIRYFKINIKFMIISSLGMVCLAFLLKPITYFLSLFTNFNYYDRYFLSSEFYEPIKLYYVAYAVGMMGVVLLFYMLKDKVKKNFNEQQYNNYEFFLMMFYISVCIRVFATFSGIFSIVNRLSIYFFFSIIMLLPYCIKLVDINYRKIVYVGVIILGFAYTTISACLRGTNGIYPYMFVWDNDLVMSISFVIILIGLSTLLIKKTYEYGQFYNKEKLK